MIQPLVFPPKEEPFPPWLPASDTRKFEEEQSETRDNTSHAKKETYTQIKWKSSPLNKEFLQKKKKEHKKVCHWLKAPDQCREPLLEQWKFNTIIKQFSTKQAWRHAC